MPGEEITTIYNRHTEECGKPPNFETDEYSYVSYFENVHGEQSIFLFDADEMEAIVYIADAGWDNPITIPGPAIVQDESVDVVGEGVIPSESETKWLRACKASVSPRIERSLEADQ